MSYRRDTFIKKCAGFLNLSLDDVKVLNIERGIFNSSVNYCKTNNYPLKWTGKEFVKHYSTHARKILANVSYSMNAKKFKCDILKGKYNPYDIVNMTKEQMNPEFWADLKLRSLEKTIVKKEKTEDGLFTCFKCKSKKTVYYQMQTRSADEPMTTYVTCTDCNTNWKC